MGLIYGGKALENRHTLKDYNTTGEATMTSHLVLITPQQNASLTVTKHRKPDLKGGMETNALYCGSSIRDVSNEPPAVAPKRKTNVLYLCPRTGDWRYPPPPPPDTSSPSSSAASTPRGPPTPARRR